MRLWHPWHMDGKQAREALIVIDSADARSGRLAVQAGFNIYMPVSASYLNMPGVRILADSVEQVRLLRQGHVRCTIQAECRSWYLSQTGKPLDV